MNLDAFAPIGLAELESTAALAVRTDRKYVIDRAVAERLLEALAPSHAMLEICGRRAFAYDTTYFDTADLACFRAHVQARRRRFKCRTRLYADTDVCALEVKVRGQRDQTVKLRRTLPASRHGDLGSDGAAFVRDCVGPSPALTPALRGHHTRVTLVGDGERCTLDFGLHYDGGGALPGELVIVEAKSEHGRSAADRALRALGSHPRPCSKYCLGVALQGRGAAPPELRPLVRLCA